MSKSWMWQSRKMPPEVAMYAAAGGSRSAVRACTRRSSPSTPLRRASRAATYPASNLRWKPIWVGTPRSRTSLATQRLVATSAATGFSQNTGSPRPAAATMSSGGAGGAAAMTTAAALPSASWTGACRTPSLSARVAARTSSASATTRASTSGWSRTTSAWAAPMRPVPIRATRMQHLSTVVAGGVVPPGSCASLVGAAEAVNLCPDIRAARCAIIGPMAGGPHRTASAVGAADVLAAHVSVDRTSPVPIYHQVALQLEALIVAERLPPGARLANEIDFADRLGVSRPTMRAAIGYLVERGLLVRKRGVGTQVVRAQVNRSLALTSLHDDLLHAGR